MEHWLSVGAGIFLIGMMLYGHYRGFLRQCVSLGALLLTIILVKISAPYMTSFIRENPTVRQNAADFILEAAGWEAPSAEELQLPSAQRTAIEQMDLPAAGHMLYVINTVLKSLFLVFPDLKPWRQIIFYIQRNFREIHSHCSKLFRQCFLSPSCHQPSPLL